MPMMMPPDVPLMMMPSRHWWIFPMSWWWWCRFHFDDDGRQRFRAVKYFPFHFSHFSRLIDDFPLINTPKWLSGDFSRCVPTNIYRWLSRGADYWWLRDEIKCRRVSQLRLMMYLDHFSAVNITDADVMYEDVMTSCRWWCADDDDAEIDTPSAGLMIFRLFRQMPTCRCAADADADAKDADVADWFSSMPKDFLSIIFRHFRWCAGLLSPWMCRVTDVADFDAVMMPIDYRRCRWDDWWCRVDVTTMMMMWWCRIDSRRDDADDCRWYVSRRRWNIDDDDDDFSRWWNASRRLMMKPMSRCADAADVRMMITTAEHWLLMIFRRDWCGWWVSFSADFQPIDYLNDVPTTLFQHFIFFDEPPPWLIWLISDDAITP